MEAHDDAGGNEDSDEDDDSDIPEIGGLEFVVGVCRYLWAFLASAGVVIVHDNFKVEEMFVETDVCDKSVGSVRKKNLIKINVIYIMFLI